MWIGFYPRYCIVIKHETVQSFVGHYPEIEMRGYGFECIKILPVIASDISSYRVFKELSQAFEVPIK